ncbi:MAG: hypothetical protein KIH63_003095 [Candidatus Saccharibacteria bacterium]|nr:hypothetical protein [Candidatus Saccharibacteria bacterium]
MRIEPRVVEEYFTDRNYGRATYMLSPERDYFTIIDPLLPTVELFHGNNPIIVEAAQSPATWAAMDKSQLCFMGDGPIERTDLKRYIGIFGQVALDFALGSTPEEVEAHFAQDYVNDALHRMYSHSSDFLIQSFGGTQDAHDFDAERLKPQFDFMRHAKALGLLDVPAAPRVTAKYPDLNNDRTEFGLRQMYGMRWLPMEQFNTKVRFNELFGLDETGMIKFLNERFGLVYTVGFSYLGSENWLHPAQRAALLVQQYDLKNRVSYRDYAQDFNRSIPGVSGDLHPYDALYGQEIFSDLEHYEVVGDKDAEILRYLMKRLQAFQGRHRVPGIQHHIDSITYGGEDNCTFVDPLHDIFPGDASVPGIQIQEAVIDESTPSMHYDGAVGAIVFRLPGVMKSRILNPRMRDGGRVSDRFGQFQAFLEDFSAYTQLGHELIIPGVDRQFGQEVAAMTEEIDAAYARALTRGRLDAANLALLIEEVGRTSLGMHDDSMVHGADTSYPFQFLAGNDLYAENRGRLHEMRTYR